MLAAAVDNTRRERGSARFTTAPAQRRFDAFICESGKVRFYCLTSCFHVAEFGRNIAVYREKCGKIV